MTYEEGVVIARLPGEAVTVIQEDGTPVVKVWGTGGPGPQGPVDTTTADNLTAHLMDPSPHPVYDDMASLSIIFENGLL